MALRKIVLGFNDTPEARDAQRLAGSLAGREDSGVIAITSASQDPARELREAAEAERADLIVIGSSHRGTMGRVYPGSVGDHLLHHAHCAVAVAPRGYARGDHYGFGIAGVGFDGRPESQRALALGRRLAAQLGARLRIVAVGGELEAKLEDAAAFARLPDAEGHVIEVDPVLREGDPAEVLADEGVELDLLVVGSRGHGAILRTMLGSVGSHVIRTCPCPVMVVPRGDG